jgi:hypothetical protein
MRARRICAHEPSAERRRRDPDEERDDERQRAARCTGALYTALAERVRERHVPIK